MMGYLSWGKQHGEFLFQIEGQIISKLISDPMSVIHPFILLPILGQIILSITIMQKQVNKRLTLIGTACLFILIGFIFIIGILSLKLSIISSTLPFISVTYFVIRSHKVKPIDISS